MRKECVVCGVLVAALMSGMAQAALVTFGATAPTPGALDISSFVGAARDLDNVGTATADGAANDGTTYVAMDRGAQGQTFLTGSKAGGYQMTGLWVQHPGYTANTDATWYMMPVGSQLGIRVTDPSASGAAGFVLASETYAVTGSEPGVLPAGIVNTPNGTGTWIHVVLGTPVALASNRTYGFDLTGILTTGFGADLFFETLGIKDTAVIGGNPYAAGSAYVSGAGGLADNVLTTAPGDRVFVVELVPEPATIALLGLGGLALRRRRS